MNLFLYGTLMQGMSRENAISGAFVDARQPGACLAEAMYFYPQGMFPMLSMSRNESRNTGRVVGEIVTIKPKWAGYLLEHLDQIEDINSGIFTRTYTKARGLETGATYECSIYVLTAPAVKAVEDNLFPEIYNMDFKAYMENLLTPETITT